MLKITFIKIGQSLSIHTDLLSPAYVHGLKSLQDQVPPFPNDEARTILEDELGQDVNDVFMSWGEDPVAEASLGKVYKLKLKSDGSEVVVKVQRPNILYQIVIDMHLILELVGPIKSIFNLNSDTVGTVDAWGKGFVDVLVSKNTVSLISFVLN